MQGYDDCQLVTTVVAEAAKENKSDKDNNPSVFAVYSVTKAATHCVFLLVMFERFCFEHRSFGTLLYIMKGQDFVLRSTSDGNCEFLTFHHKRKNCDENIAVFTSLIFLNCF